MRNIDKEAWLWQFFTSPQFYEQAAQACDAVADYFASLALAKGMGNYGRNNQIYDAYRENARDFRRGAEFTQHDEYSVANNAAVGVNSTGRGIAVNLWPFHWMDEKELAEFTRLDDRAGGYANFVEYALQNGLTGGDKYLDKDSHEPEILNQDDGFPGDRIIEEFDFYNQECGYGWTIPDPLPHYTVDRTRPCKTTETVPWTGVWLPETGLEQHSLTFAIKGKPMQPVYRIEKTAEEVEALQEQGVEFKYLPTGQPLCKAIETTWYPLVPEEAPAKLSSSERLRALPNDVVPKTGSWWSPAFHEAGGVRHFQQGERFPATAMTSYGAVIWYYEPDQQPPS